MCKCRKLRVCLAGRRGIHEPPQLADGTYARHRKCCFSTSHATDDRCLVRTGNEKGDRPAAVQSRKGQGDAWIGLGANDGHGPGFPILKNGVDRLMSNSAAGKLGRGRESRRGSRGQAALCKLCASHETRMGHPRLGNGLCPAGPVMADEYALQLLPEGPAGRQIPAIDDRQAKAAWRHCVMGRCDIVFEGDLY